MTPPVDSQQKRASDSRPLDFQHWLAANGMNPTRRRPAGRLAALLMSYRAYLEQTVGRENAGQWFEKYARKAEAAAGEAKSASEGS